MSLKAFIQQSFDMNRRELVVNLQDLTEAELSWRPAPHSNSIGFLVWHMSRVEDGWVVRVLQGNKHLWVTDGWAQKFGMPEDQRDMGFGYSQEQVDSFKTPSLELLLAYSGAVREATNAFLDDWPGEADAAEFKAPWGGTILTRDVLAQLVWELNQHGGQVGYIRGLQRGLERPEFMGPLSTA